MKKDIKERGSFKCRSSLYIGGNDKTMKEGVALAGDLIDSGKAEKVLEKLIQISNLPDKLKRLSG